jgi:hypothetical protein
MKDELDSNLDPSKNPFIDASPVPSAGGDVDGDGLAPMFDLSVTPEAIVKKISEVFPGQNEIQIGGRTFVLMAAGNHTDKASGERLEDLNYGDLMRFYESLTAPR